MHERLAQLLDEFETRRCEHCGRTLRPASPVREKPAA
jgi:hypothetical protein